MKQTTRSILASCALATALLAPLTAHADAERDGLLQQAQMWTGMAHDEVPKADANSYLDEIAKTVKWCHKSVKDALDAGIDPATELHWDDFTIALGKADAEVCAPGDAKLAELKAALSAPYKAVLKNDKLDLILKALPGGYFINKDNYNFSINPKALAKAANWFEILERDPGDGDSCLKKVYTYRKLAFDKKHKLKKVSEREYCGDPGPKAMK